MIAGAAFAALLEAAAGASVEAPLTVRETIVVADRAPVVRTDTPAAVSVLVRDEIAGLPATNLAEILDALPGLQMHFPEAFGGVPMLAARGFFGAGEAEYLQLRVDGVPAADAESGVADWRALRAEEIERIEVLRGPGSALYGDTALGGVVDVVTRPPLGPPSGRAALSAASFETLEGDAAYARRSAPWDLTATASANRTEGFRRFGETTEHGFHLRGGVTTSAVAGGRASAALSFGDRERGESGPLSPTELAADRRGANPLFQNDREDRRWWRAAGGWDGDTRAGTWRARVHFGARDVAALRTLLLAENFGDSLERDLSTRTAGGSIEATRQFRLRSGIDRTSTAADLGWGLDVARESLQTEYRPPGETTQVAAASARRLRAGVFAAPSFEIGDRLRLVTGLRWDTVRDRHDGRQEPEQTAWSPRLGLTARIGPSDAPPITAYLQAARAFKAPTLDQRFDPRPFPDFAGGTFQISNPSLSPQRAVHAEAGLRGTTTKARWEAAFYRTAVEDEIDFDPATFRYVNIGSSLHRGAEAAVVFQPIGGERGLRPELSYAWTRVEPRSGENRGRQLKNIPEHLLRAGVTAELPQGVAIAARLAWQRDRFLDDGNRFPLENTATADLRLAWTPGRYRLLVDLLNVTDQEASAIGYLLTDAAGAPAPHYFPAPGFAWRLGVAAGW